MGTILVGNMGICGRDIKRAGGEFPQHFVC